MKTIRKTKSYVILSAAKHLFVSVMITVSASFAQQASTPPRGDKVPRHIRSLPGEFAIAPLSLSMDLARLEAELVGLGPSLAALAPASLAQLDAERAMVGVLSVAPLAPMAFIPPLEHLSVDLLRLDAELAQAPMHMLDAPFVHFDLPGDIDWGDGENPQQDPGYQTYKEGYNLILQEKWNEARTKLSEVARRFSSSRYVDDAQYWIAYSWMQAQPKKAAELYREFFKKYPTSNYFDDAVADLGRLEGQSAADSARSARAAYEAQSLAGRMKTPTAAVAPALPNDPKVAGATIIVPPGGRYLVEEQSGSPELRIKKDAIEALGRKPDEVALKTLQEIAMDQSQHRELRQSAMNALQRADRGKALELYISVAKSDPDEDVRKDAVYYIGQYARKDDERAFGILKDYAADSKQPPEVRESAMHALKETKKGDVLNLYVQLAKSDPDTRIKKTALYYIGQLARGDDERAHKVLKDYALDRSQDKEVRETALYALKEVKNANALNVYLDIAKNDPNNDMRRTAIYYIGQLAKKDDEKAYQVLKEYAFDTKQDVELRETALHSLREMRRADILSLLVELAKNDPVEKFRSSAIYQIGQLRKYYGPEVLKVLRDLVLDQKQPREIRKSAMYALRQQADEDVFNTLVSLAKNDPDQEIQQSAIYYIRESGKDKNKSFEVLVQLFDTLPAEREEAQKTCLYAVAELGGDKSVDFLIKVAKTHRNYELRQSAVYYLGNIGGEKARSALMEILKGK